MDERLNNLIYLNLGCSKFVMHQPQINFGHFKINFNFKIFEVVTGIIMLVSSAKRWK